MNELVQFDRAELRPITAIRSAIGIAVPLVAGLAWVGPRYGVAAAAGALSVGFASFLGTYRGRTATMLVTAFVMGLSTFAGAMAEGSPLALTVAITLWAGLAGLVSTLGPEASVVSNQAVIALMVMGKLPLGMREAAVQSVLVTAGGLVQVLLFLALWPFVRHTGERRALSVALEGLGAYAASRTSGEPEGAFKDARFMLQNVPPFAYGRTFAFGTLLDEAESIRESLGLVIAGRERAGTPREVRDALGRLLEIAAGILREIGGAVLEARTPRVADRAWRAMEETLAAIRGVSRDDGDIDDLVTEGHALASRLWAAMCVAAMRSAELRARRVPGEVPMLFMDAVHTVRANLTLRSAIGRHALRLAVCVAFAVFLSHLVPLQRAYWLPLTTLLVLKPDFATTQTRALARMAGTVTGALVASLIVLVHPNPATHAALAVLCAWAGYLTFRASYAVFNVCVTAFVVLLAGYFGGASATVVADRVLATVIGGALALVAYAVWPTGSDVRTGERLAALLEAQSRYTGALLRALSAPRGDATLRALRKARNAELLAFEQAEDAVTRQLEVTSNPSDVSARAAAGVLNAVRHVILAEHDLHARVAHDREVPAPPPADWGAQLTGELDRLAGLLRTIPRPPAPPLPARVTDAPDDASLDWAIRALRAGVALDALSIRRA